MVTPIQRQQQFFTSYSFYEGLRLTIGIMVPILVSIYFNNLQWGVLAAFGALAAGITDVTGPPHHRVNGILATTGFLYICVPVTMLLRDMPLLLALWLVLTSFFFSFIILYGNRAGQIGSAVLLIIVLVTDPSRSVEHVWVSAGFVATGSLAYLVLSIIMHRARPYKLAQQVLGECMVQTANFLSVKAKFYDVNEDPAALDMMLAQAQHAVNESQERTREVLFKTRSIVKESTHTGRVLLLAFVDLIDLFESVMSGQHNYHQLHERLQHTGIMDKMHALLMHYASLMEETGLAFQQGKALPKDRQSAMMLKAIEAEFDKFKEGKITREDIDFFLSVRRLLDAYYAIERRMKLLQFYTSYDKKIETDRALDYQLFVLPSSINKDMALGNFSWQSNIMRYAVRMTLSMLAGYAATLLMPLGHDYWLLLTILVILKPAYSITAKRNRDRLLGTALGAVAGYLLLYFITNTTVLLILMLMAMIVAFSFMRNRYFQSVTLITVYVLIAFRLLRAGDLDALIVDRVIDTLIGSVIAFLFMWFIPPLWEKQTIAGEASKCLQASKAYLHLAIQNVFDSAVELEDYKYLRKQAFVKYASLSDTFQRMNNEPQWVQANGQLWYQMLVHTNALISNAASLAALKKDDYSEKIKQALAAYKLMIASQLQDTIDILEGKGKEKSMDYSQRNQHTADKLHEEAESVLMSRINELQQQDDAGYFKERLRIISHLDNTLNNLYYLGNDIQATAAKLVNSETAA